MKKKANTKKLSTVTFSLLLLFLVSCSNVIVFKPSPYLNPFPKEVKVVSDKQATPPTKFNWNLSSIGLNKATRDEDPELKGNFNIKIAILSTGIDYNHKDLAQIIEVNKSEITVDASGVKRINYKDDDEDGLKDNIVGWDVVEGNGFAYDRHGAGTAVAGIIAARANKEMQGIMEKVTLYPVKYTNDNGQATLGDLVEAIKIALKAKPNIMFIQNITLQLSRKSNIATAQIDTLALTLKSLFKSGIPVVIGSGENLQQFGVSKIQKIFLKTLQANLVVVSSIDKNNKVPFLANTSFHNVTTFAPGKDIKTTGLNNTYQTVTGTAYAAAHVTAAIAIAIAKFGKKFNAKVFSSVLADSNSGNRSNNLKKLSRSGSYLNIPKFIKMLEASK